MDNVFERLDMLRPIGVPKDAGTDPRPAPPPPDSLTPDAFRALLVLSQTSEVSAPDLSLNLAHLRTIMLAVLGSTRRPIFRHTEVGHSRAVCVACAPCTQGAAAAGVWGLHLELQWSCWFTKWSREDWEHEAVLPSKNALQLSRDGHCDGHHIGHYSLDGGVSAAGIETGKDRVATDFHASSYFQSSLLMRRVSDTSPWSFILYLCHLPAVSSLPLSHRVQASHPCFFSPIRLRRPHPRPPAMAMCLVWRVSLTSPQRGRGLQSPGKDGASKSFWRVRGWLSVDGGWNLENETSKDKKGGWGVAHWPFKKSSFPRLFPDFNPIPLSHPLTLQKPLLAASFPCLVTAIPFRLGSPIDLSKSLPFPAPSSFDDCWISTLPGGIPLSSWWLAVVNKAKDKPCSVNAPWPSYPHASPRRRLKVLKGSSHQIRAGGAINKTRFKKSPPPFLY